jgi:hypothetical protein
MTNNRKHLRHQIRVSIKITHESIGECLLETRDISDSGIFVIVNPQKMPDVGTVLKGQVQGMGEEGAIIDMVIVRVNKNGLGLRYVNL